MRSVFDRAIKCSTSALSYKRLGWKLPPSWSLPKSLFSYSSTLFTPAVLQNSAKYLVSICLMSALNSCLVSLSYLISSANISNSFFYSLCCWLRPFELWDAESSCFSRTCFLVRSCSTSSSQPWRSLKRVVSFYINSSLRLCLIAKCCASSLLILSTSATICLSS